MLINKLYFCVYFCFSFNLLYAIALLVPKIIEPVNYSIKPTAKSAVFVIVGINEDMQNCPIIIVKLTMLS